MGYGLIPYLVQDTKLESVIGSKDSDRLRWIEAQSSREMERIDEIFEDSIEEGAPTIQAAMADLIHGAELDRRAGAQYAYAFEILCRLLGERLDNREWYPIGPGFYDDVNAVLEKAGADVNLWLTLQTTPPFGIPTPDDFPAMGYLTKAAAKESQLELAKVSEQALQNAAAASKLGTQLVRSIRQLKAWFERAATEGKGLAFFYY